MDRAVAEDENVLPDCRTKQSPARKTRWLLRADLTAEAGRHGRRGKDSIPSPGLLDPRGFSNLPVALPPLPLQLHGSLRRPSRESSLPGYDKALRSESSRSP